MKQILRNIRKIIAVSVFLGVFYSNGLEASCNWKGLNPVFRVNDTCFTTFGVMYNELKGIIRFNTNNSGCFRYTWKVNDTTVEVSPYRSFTYQVNKSGIYKVCVSVYDSCNRCDTSFCYTDTVVSCLQSCNWKGRNPVFGVNDTCYKTNVMNTILRGSIRFKSNNSGCLSYTWKVNGTTVGTDSSFAYQVNKNGIYKVCVSVYDSCNRCDTSFCYTDTVSCLQSCNWKGRNPYFGVYDSCSQSNGKYIALTGTIGFNSNLSGCFRYTWKVNGAVVGTGGSYFYQVNTNGIYKVCVDVYDSCNRCDTSFCYIDTFSCLNSCNWSSRNAYFKVWDSCRMINNGKQASLHGYLYYNSNNAGCYKYTWKVNGTVVAKTQTLSYKVNYNGNYSVCVNVYDTCNKCDTTFCMTKTVSCYSGSKCNWSSLKPYFTVGDSCQRISGKSTKLEGYIYYNPNHSGCFRYTWKVNGAVVANAPAMSYKVTKNGIYNVCVVVYDTCNKCDTSYCITKTISCISSGCNWSNRNAYFKVWDSCRMINNGKQASLHGHLYYNSNNAGCYKYTWKVNGTVVAKTQTLSYKVNYNGTYSVCVNVYDTCNKCDTSYCMTKTVSCFNNCNWKSRVYTIHVFDSCNGKRYTNSTNGYVVMNQHPGNCCMKYTWKINGRVVSNTFFFNVPVRENGTISYCLTLQDTCNQCDTSICFTRKYSCGNLGMIQIERSTVDVYPNPTDGVVTINSSNPFDKAEIVDVSGQVVWTGNIREGENIISLKGFAKGVYIIYLRDEDETLVRKVLLE